MELSEEQKELAKKLSPKQLKFANLHALKAENKLSDADCYKEAGYSVKSQRTAEVNASKLLKNAKVSDYLDSLKVAAAEEAGLTLEYLDRKLYDMLETNITDIAEIKEIEVTLVGGLKTTQNILVVKDDLNAIPERAINSINSVKVSNQGVQYTMPDKKGLLELAMKRFDALKETREHTGPGGTPLLTATPEQIEEARQSMRKRFGD